MPDSPLRRLPSVHDVLQSPQLAGLQDLAGPSALTDSVRQAVQELRARLLTDPNTPTSIDPIAQRARELLLLETRPHLRPVLNATGILLHTGLGRAPLAPEAIEHVRQTASGYCNLELDLETGSRGHRTSLVSSLLTRLTGAPAASVVNNNAAATVLALRALAQGREVLVSRGQLVEIGGSFRLPEVFEASGARLKEVGTTNKTRLRDYEHAISPDTAAILRVHTSNFRIVGFTESVPLPHLSALATSKGLLLIDDVGSGALKPGSPPLPSHEPSIADSLTQGADLVLCSGDKLLGGPQCGLILGRPDVVASLERDPLMRAFRVDKLTLAALEATLRLMLNPDRARTSIPLWNALSASPETLKRRADHLAEQLRERLNLNVQAAESTACLGGGSVPAKSLPSFSLRLDPPWPKNLPSADAVHHALRTGTPSVVARVHARSLWLDLRTLPEPDDPLLFQALTALMGRA